MIAALGGLAGKAISGIFGWLLSHPLILAGLLIVVAYNFGYWLGERDGTRDMVSKLEIASLEAEIANMKAEKKIAEDAAKQAATDKADLEELAAQQQGEINAYRKKLEAAGRKCELTPDDYCSIYGLRSKECKSHKRKTSDIALSLARRLQPHPIAASYWQRIGRPKGGRGDKREQYSQAD